MKRVAIWFDWGISYSWISLVFSFIILDLVYLTLLFFLNCGLILCSSGSSTVVMEAMPMRGKSDCFMGDSEKTSYIICDYLNNEHNIIRVLDLPQSLWVCYLSRNYHKFSATFTSQIPVSWIGNRMIVIIPLTSLLCKRFPLVPLLCTLLLLWWKWKGRV